ncbi:MAG: tetratricopeptide repeat protein [Pyrinomonadaceae bacterium]
MFQPSKAPCARPVLLCLCVLFAATLAQAQEAGGDLVGGAGIFRPRNPEAKRSSNPSRPVRPRLTPAEIEEKYQDSISDGNDARDARKFAAAESSYRAAANFKPHDARAFIGLGNIYVDQHRWNDAEDAYRKALEFAATNPDVLTALSFVLVEPRSGALNAKRFTDAEYFARRATQLQPTNAVAFDRLGAAMIARGIFNADAEAALRRAVELDPNLVVAKVHLARVLRHTNRYAEADPMYRSAIDQAKDAPTLVLIADAMQSEQSWADSEPVLRRALDLDARNPGALFLMARVLSANRKYAEAEPLLKTVIELSPKFFLARSILARSYLGLERYDDAFKTYEQAVDLASDADRKQLAGAFGFAGVGDGYMKSGRTKDAMRAYTRGLQIDPDNAELRAKIAAARASTTR